MDLDDDLSSNEIVETGSDELLSDDHLRLPENASPLVRIHAIRAWLSRQQQETSLAIGEAALTLQELQQQENSGTRLRRRELEALRERSQQAQQALEDAQQRLHTYEEAEALFEDCVTHTTSNERILVEYYLTLEEMLQQGQQETTNTPSPSLAALQEVQQRVVHVSTPVDE